MTNDFSQLDAQNPDHRLAQISPEEQEEANAYYAELEAKMDAEIPFPPSPVTRRSWDLLNSIHAEIAATLETKHSREALLDAIGAC